MLFVWLSVFIFIYAFTSWRFQPERGLSIFWLIITVILYLFCLFSIKNESEKVVLISGFYATRIFRRQVLVQEVYVFLKMIAKHQREIVMIEILSIYSNIYLQYGIVLPGNINIFSTWSTTFFFVEDVFITFTNNNLNNIDWYDWFHKEGYQ